MAACPCSFGRPSDSIHPPHRCHRKKVTMYLYADGNTVRAGTCSGCKVSLRGTPRWLRAMLAGLVFRSLYRPGAPPFRSYRLICARP